MRCLHEVYYEKGSLFGVYLLTIQNACPTIKAFYIESQSKQVFKQQYSFKYDSESGKTNKNGRKQGRLCVIEFHFFLNTNKIFRVAGKN